MKHFRQATTALLLMGMLLPLAACANDDGKAVDTTASPSAVTTEAVTTEPVPEVDPNDPQL